MRSKNALRNLSLYLLYEALIFVLGLIFPKFIILTYGSEINGLTSTITRMLSIINLIQAGAVGAAIFQMYKPVADGDYEMQSSILFSSKKYYFKITFLYFVIAVVLSVIFSFRLSSSNLKFFEVFFAFFILTLNGASTLLITSICDIYISSHQKKYLLIISLFANVFVHYGLLTVVLVFRLHFIFIYLSYLMGGIVNVVLNYVFYKKLSKGKITNNPKDKGFVIRDKKYLMLASVGNEAITASPPVIITMFIDLIQTSVFSIYSLVFTSMKTILNSIQLSISPIFGNLVKTSDDNRISQVYDVIQFVTLLLGTICSCCVGFLLIPFVYVYTLKINDANYIYPILSVFVAIYIVLISFRASFGFVATVYGFFKKTCWITLAFGAIGILSSVVCIVFFGMPYVMVGLLTYELGCSISILIILKRGVPWFSLKKLITRFVVMILLSSCSVATYLLLKPSISSWLEWIKWGVCVGLSTIAILAVYCLVFERKCLSQLIGYFKNLFRSKGKRAR